MAGTIIDALIVTLGLDRSKFDAGTKGTRDDLDRTVGHSTEAAKEIERQGAVAARFFTKMRNEALALFAVFTAGRGIKDFIRDITLGDAAAGHLAANVGMSTQDLSAWEGAAERAGGSAAGMAASIAGLSADFETFKLTGDSKVLPLLKQLGIEARDVATGAFRPMSEIMLEIADKMAKMSLPDAQAFGRQFGFDAGTVQLLHEGRAEIEKLLAAQQKMGVPNNADAERGQHLLNHLADIRQSITSVARNALASVTPQIDALLGRLEKWLVDKQPQINEALQRFGDFLVSVDWEEVGDNLLGILQTVNAIVQAFGGWQTVLETLFGLWLGTKLIGVLAGMSSLARGASVLAGAFMNPAVLAALAIWLAFMAAYKRFKTPDTQEEFDAQMGNLAPDSPLWKGIPHEQQLRYPNSPDSRERDGGKPETGWDMLKRWWGGGSKTTAEQDKASDQAIAWFTSKEGGGYSAEQAAGVAGNLQQESGFNPQSGLGTDHVGIAQWSQKRRDAIFAQFNKRIEDMSYAEQLRAITWEMSPQGPEAASGAALRKETTPDGAGRSFGHNFERPGNYAAEDAIRGGNASNRLRKWLGGPGIGAGASAAGAVHNSSASSQVNINGPITVQTNATDANGVARGLGKALKEYAVVQQYNSGLA